MSTNGVSEEVFHLLYESEDSNDDDTGIELNSHQAEKPLLRSQQSSSNNETSQRFPVISHDPKFNESITVASKNGIINIPKEAIPPSLIRSRSSGKFAETSFFGTRDQVRDGSIKIDPECFNSETLEDNFVYKKLHPGETIQGIALQYHTTVAEIKRINNLISDQDLFALKHLKVPTTKHSVLKETHSSALPPSPPDFSSLDGAIPSSDPHLPGSSSSLEPTAATHRVSAGDTPHDLSPATWLESRTISINQAMTISAEILQSDLSQMCSQAFSRASSVEVIQKSRVKDRTAGADWGIKWQYLVMFMLVFCVAIPLVYLLFRSFDDGKESSNGLN